MSKQDVDKMKMLVALLDDAVELGEKVFDDGKVDFADLSKAPELVKLMTAMFGLMKDHGKEIIEELKDIDFGEAIEVIAEAKK